MKTPTQQTPVSAATEAGANENQTHNHCIDKDAFFQFLEALHANCEGRANLRFLPSRVSIFTNRTPGDAVHCARRHVTENIYVGVATRKDDSSGDSPTAYTYLPSLSISISKRAVRATCGGGSMNSHPHRGPQRQRPPCVLAA